MWRISARLSFNTINMQIDQNEENLGEGEVRPLAHPFYDFWFGHRRVNLISGLPD